MHETNIARADLNLLVVFDAIASTRSVSRAAGRLALSQPAVSHALRRLRDLVDDPLFVRGRDGLAPTPRALMMISPVREILDSVERVLADGDFNPEMAQLRFRIAASDYSMMTIAPACVAELRRAAPLSTIEMRHAGEDTLALLESGDLDLAFWGAAIPDGPFRALELFREHYVGLICARHPLAIRAGQGALTLDDYLAFPHMVASFRDPRLSPVDAELEALGRSRTIGVVTPNFAANVACLRGNDLIVSLPARLVARVNLDHLVVFALPLNVPDYAYSIIWHHRTERDVASIWFRELVSRCTKDPSLKET